MIKDITFFETKKELEELTGLTENELWDKGFNLDDIDWGIVTSGVNILEHIDEFGCKSWEVDYNSDEPYYIRMLLSWMDSHCVGYRYVEYNGKQYFTLHHA